MINRQQITLPSTPQTPVETWKALEINELDEMERLQSLKQRENLLKGMGITELVNKMLLGTSGTVATLPSSLIIHQNNQIQQHQHDNDINNRNNMYQNNKYEVKTKNYNPFENQSLFAEVNSFNSYIYI